MYLVRLQREGKKWDFIFFTVRLTEDCLAHFPDTAKTNQTNRTNKPKDKIMLIFQDPSCIYLDIILVFRSQLLSIGSVVNLVSILTNLYMYYIFILVSIYKTIQKN